MRRAGVVGVALALLTGCAAGATKSSPATVTVVATPTPPPASAPSPVDESTAARAEVPVAAIQFFSRPVVIAVPLSAPGRGEMAEGTYRGLEIELAVHLAAALGTPRSQIVWIDGKSSIRELLITTGQVDIAIGSYAITPKRSESVAFAGPYLIGRRYHLVRRSEDQIAGPGDLNGRKLCSVTGSTGATALLEDFAVTAELVEADSYEECIGLLTRGSVDAVTGDDLLLATMATALSVDRQVRLVGQSTRATPYGIGMKKGSADLCSLVAGTMDRMWQDGSMERLLVEWTGTTGYQATKAKAPSPTPCTR